MIQLHSRKVNFIFTALCILLFVNILLLSLYNIANYNNNAMARTAQTTNDTKRLTNNAAAVLLKDIESKPKFQHTINRKPILQRSKTLNEHKIKLIKLNDLLNPSKKPKKHNKQRNRQNTISERQLRNNPLFRNYRKNI